MAIPTQTEMHTLVLELLGDGKARSPKQVNADVLARIGITPEEAAQTTSSGRPVYESRAQWAVSWLCALGLARRPSRGLACITERGLRALASDDLAAELAFLRSKYNKRRHEARKAQSAAAGTNEAPEEAQDKSPVEQVDDAVAAIHASLADELLARILEVPGREGDDFFERLTVELLDKMGYGTGAVTPSSADGGIDGKVLSDAFGFDRVFTQAKRFTPGNVVDRPLVQAFIGSLGKCPKGVFFTTSTFSKGAVEAAEQWPHAEVRLVDGERLTSLMIQYGLGVSTERSVEIKRLDIDYFER